MEMLYPFTFHPIFKERVWGGRNLERLYQKALPPNQRIGESWEITDRPEGISTIANGPLAGRSLRWLMEHHRQDILGQQFPPQGPFPLLIKLLDATETLSVQVHPPSQLASRLKGEPKTELWYVADATPAANLFVGLKQGVTRAEFEQRIAEGTVAEALHRLAVRPGDAIYLPSGRVHAIGAGNVIFEIQQNSDTTFRVFDWNRMGLDGKPRQLHVAESLASIDFEDFEPQLIADKYAVTESCNIRPLVDGEFFRVDLVRFDAGQRLPMEPGRLHLLGQLQGRLTAVCAAEHRLTLDPGNFCLLPACLHNVCLTAETSGELLVVQAK